MTSPIIFAGAESCDFGSVGAAIATTGNIAVDTTAGRFRAGYARSGLNVSGVQATVNSTFLTTPSLGSISSFWFTGRMWGTVGVGGSSFFNAHPLEFYDAAGILRLQLRNTNGSTAFVQFGGPFVFEKVTAAGVATQLGLGSSGGFTVAPAVGDKVDVFVNYGTSGSVLLYINGTLVLNTGTVDTTTNSNTALDLIRIGAVSSCTTGTVTPMFVWSEVIVATRDTRNMSLVTQVPTANGNTHTFTSNSPTNMAASIYSDALPDYSNTAGQIDEYQMTPAMPTGNFGVVSVVQHARAAIGTSGPTKMQMMVRTGGTDYSSGTISPGGVFGLTAANWDTNPNTGAAWLTSDLAASSTAFNAGVISVT